MSRWLIYGVVAALAASVAVASGCGETELDDLAEGESFEMGELRYNVLFTRNLNPNDVEDGGYLVGQPPAPPGKEYLGVFLLIDNRSEEILELPKQSDFEVTDTTGAVYHPLESQSEFEFPYGGSVEGEGQVPDPDGVAAAGPTQGALLLFLVDESVTENRPLELDISSQDEEAVVELDI